MLRTGWLVVRRTVRVPPSGRSMVRVSSATWIVTVWWAWIRPRAIFCPTTITIPVLLARRCTRTGSRLGRGTGPGGRCPRSRSTSSGVSGLARVRSSSPGVRVVEHQRGGDADPDPAPAEDLRGEHLPSGQGHRPDRVDGPLDLDRHTVLARRQRGRPGGAGAAGGQRGQIRRGQMRTPVFTRTPLDRTWIRSVSHHNVTGNPARAVPSQNCWPAKAASADPPTPPDRLQIPALPRAQRLPGHPDLGGDLTHESTAQDRQNRPIPLLDDRQVDQSHSWPPPTQRPQTTRTWKPNRTRRQACPGTPTSSMSWHTDVKHVPDQDTRGSSAVWTQDIGDTAASGDG
jgi:hypothetical protein